uniref:hypothetical protein n=1 Tax=Kitasatospora indigofera TaxID=67307 RepID=UPI002F913AC2
MDRCNPAGTALVASRMNIPWAAILGTAAAVFSAAAAGLSWLTARKANETSHTLAALEHDRWHSELTPDLGLTFLPRHGQPIALVALRGPVALDRLDSVTVNVLNDDDGLDRGAQAGLGGSVPRADLLAQIWGPYSLRPTPGDEHGRSAEPFPLDRTNTHRLVLEPTRPPHWSYDLDPQHWLAQWQDKPIRLSFECRRDGHRPWTVIREITARQRQSGAADGAADPAAADGAAQPDANSPGAPQPER